MLLLCFAVLALSAAAEAQRIRKLGHVQSNSTNTSHPPSDVGLPTLSIVLGAISAVIVVVILFLAGVTFLKQRFFKSSSGTAFSATVISRAAAAQGLVEFPLKEILSMTNNFSERIGTGFLGSVYKGLLPDQATVVAVKKLTNCHGTDREFRSCVAGLGSVSHPALVRLHGFCSDGIAKLLVYEFIPNGSLDKVLFDDPGQLGWEFRHNTALAIARGVDYLHQQQMPVIHGNIKSGNVLLDGNYQPKLCDTGLCSLVDRRRLKSAVSEGIHGYLSPEWSSDEAEVTTKTDVYGFGIFLLEMIGGRRLVDLSKRAEEWNLAEWAIKQAKSGKYLEIVDPQLKNKEQLISVIDTALKCIHHDANSRPSMARVVELLARN